MDTTVMIFGGSAAVSLASLAYGVWQAGRAKTYRMKNAALSEDLSIVEAAKDRCARKIEVLEKESSARLNKLMEAEQDIRDLGRSLQATEANLAAEKRSHATTKGNLTRLKNSAQA